MDVVHQQVLRSNGGPVPSREKKPRPLTAGGNSGIPSTHTKFCHKSDPHGWESTPPIDWERDLVAGGGLQGGGGVLVGSTVLGVGVSFDHELQLFG